MVEPHPLHQVSTAIKQAPVINAAFLPRVRYDLPFRSDWTLLGIELSTRPPTEQLIDTLNEILPSHTGYKAIGIVNLPNQQTTVLARLVPA
jgi:hypothetical protein